MPDASHTSSSISRGQQAAIGGIILNLVLAIVKILSGLLGNSYALVADGIESSVDILGSAVVWGGLQIAAREPDEDFPFGYGKAESLASLVVALLALGAATGIVIESIHEILTPHKAPESWTLGILVAVVAVKVAMSWRVHRVGRDIGSGAVQNDALHHLSDALTSLAAIVGVGLAVLGGPQWAPADDWAALVAGAVIAVTGITMLRKAILELMDRGAEADYVERVRALAAAVEGVRAVEKLAVRKSGLVYRVNIHIHADPAMSLRDAHALSGKVKWTIRTQEPTVQSVLVHMEPDETL